MTSISRAIHDADLIGRERDSILAERSYVLHRQYAANTTWCAHRMDGPKILYNRAATAPLRSSVVGIVSAEGLFMDNHGDFDMSAANATIDNFKEASYRFSLRAPSSDDPEYAREFAQDFAAAMSVIEDLASALPDKASTTSPFLSEIDVPAQDVSKSAVQRLLNFSRKIFQHFTTYGLATVEYVQPSSLEGYVIHEDCKHLVRQIRYDHLARNIHIWDTNGFSIPPQHRAAFLKNKLVQVYYRLRYLPGEGMFAEFDSVSVFSEEYAVWEKFL